MFIGKLLRALRSPQEGEQVKVAAVKCRKFTNDGSVAVCDEQIEISTTPIELEEVPAVKCRNLINNGSVVAVCDEKIEIRDTTIEEINEERDNLGPIACTPEDENCDDDDFEKE